MHVPTVTSLDEIYPADALLAQAPRWDGLLESFKAAFDGRKPDFVARSPGRVNLIGEHIDYSQYEVLPMAVTVDVLLAVAARPDVPQQARIANVEEAKFPRREFGFEKGIEIDSETLEWSNYFKCGLRVATELLRRKRGPEFVPVGLDVLVDGSVPSGGGLSSSAAFVCASALAAMRANGEREVDKKELVELAIVSERAVGVQSGGMDQSASVFGERGSALYVSFKPTLQATPVHFPSTDPELVFVVAQSFVAADKHTSAPVHYNLRVVECALAAAFLAKIFRVGDLPSDSTPLGLSLRGFHDAYFEKHEGVKDNTTTPRPQFQAQLDVLLSLVDDYLTQEEGYTREQIAGVLGMSGEELTQCFFTKFPVRAERFMLRQRAQHVFAEAARVLKFRDLLEGSPAEGEGGGEALLKKLGELMNETQESCCVLYECSCAELDELCKLARGAGAYGSRLTGAGWGGCSVHLVPKDKVEKVREVWVERYYRRKWPDITEERLREAIVVSKPGSGSCVYEVEK
ncbi:galactokinase-like protein [Trichodelitschia bisporula]|uniref:Galactokinase n=1 Tax=Trichodelitschia bisporula TaxID=703511 RepID=A0A6G1HQZ6_9PEZI|nr:galactokinase-like protein [Trichodelitschia bisporula]